jgi:UDP-GlcNAc:undecaprenyl-phosphate GlcNAc-1-phosphate transferase
MNASIYEYALALGLSFLLVFGLTPFIRKLALKTNFVDNPSQRKIHAHSIPLLGGLAVFTGFFIMVIYDILIVPHRQFDRALTGYLGGALLIMIIGLLDDRYSLRPGVKFLAQIIASLIFLISNDLTTLFGPAFITLPILLFWMVSLINAFNFLDNMDGISTGVSGILALGFYSIAFMTKTTSLVAQMHYISLLSLTFAGAVFGFLPYNFNPAKMFLGDAGSLFIGYFLASMGILTGKLAVIRMNNNLYFLLPVLLLSFPLFDICLVSYTRKRDGRRVTQGGKDHSTHRIVNALKSPKITSLVVYLINIIIVLLTIIILRTNSHILLIISVLFFGVGFYLFGVKLDSIPIVVTKNQLKAKSEVEGKTNRDLEKPDR